MVVEYVVEEDPFEHRLAALARDLALGTHVYRLNWPWIDVLGDMPQYRSCSEYLDLVNAARDLQDSSENA